MPFVPGYTHTPGHHCGSTALRNLLAFDGVEISEEMAFGLGAGACFYYVTIEDASPTRWFNGRTARLEENFDELTGAALELRTFKSGDDGAWAAASAEVDAGRPALLLTDLYHLDHYGNSAHFPGHAVVLAGYDEEVVYLSDTGFEQLQTTRLENLDRARHSDHPAYPLAGHMFTASGETEPAQLRAAIPAAIERAANAMVEPEFRDFSGLDAARRLAAEAGSWPEV
ncbi:MAG: BtrH N-terminal domain-containing protein, partial [Solirubrobacterales bacterium]